MEVEALRPADDVDAPVSLDFEDWVEACAGSLMSLAYVVGCQGHGFDDGVHLRTLTREAIAPFIAGINSFAVLSGSMGSIWSGT
jgi:hypothetical protein